MLRFPKRARKSGCWKHAFIHAKIIVKSDRRCPRTITDRIEINPMVMMGKPVIRGTRLTVVLIL
jgi:hypothetical protein